LRSRTSLACGTESPNAPAAERALGQRADSFAGV